MRTKNQTGQDNVAWSGAASRVYSSSSAYEWLAKMDTSSTWNPVLRFWMAGSPTFAAISLFLSPVHILINSIENMSLLFLCTERNKEKEKDRNKHTHTERGTK
ncbi:hypothetical protein glysoja_025427 [Glycine soja]|uniref:Uncharacterized protein n=1 Tax=Glycine soja TaxID=3848 RepID=A0A0B2R9Q2_GLYSO|nr:hypothetical protein glysoja_025427 [Glycine soja]